MGKLAVVRIRGLVNVTQGIRDTMNMLHLYRKNYCAVVQDNESNRGMLSKIKDYATYGEIDEETYKALVDKRGEEFKGRESDSKGKIKYEKFVLVGKKKIKPFFRLSPPRGGFERKGIKKSFVQGGALGNRKEKMKDLIMRMV